MCARAQITIGRFAILQRHIERGGQGRGRTPRWGQTKERGRYVRDYRVYHFKQGAQPPLTILANM